MSDQVPDPGAPQVPPGPESEPGVAHTEAVANAGFATGPVDGAVVGAAPGAAAGGIPGGFPAAEPVPQAAYEYGYAGAGHTAPAPGEGGPDAGGHGPEPSAGQPAGKGRRGRWIIGLGLGYAVLAAGTAFGVIGAKSPAPVDVTAVNASAYAAGTASPGPGSSGAATKASPSASHTTAAPTSAAPTTATPTSTVTGTVSGGIHHGDLRYFLLPPPQGPSSVQGDPDGTSETLDQVVTEYGGTSDVRTFLEQSDFKTACTRKYQDSTMGANVTIELMQFGSSSEAANWMSGFQLNSSDFKSISVPGESGAQGWSYAKNGAYQLLATYREGDTFFQVSIFGTQTLPTSDLGQVVSAEHSRLANG